MPVVVGVDQLAKLLPDGVLVGLAPELAVLEEHRAEAGVPGADHVHQAVFLHVDSAEDPQRLEQQRAGLIAETLRPNLLPGRHVAGLGIALAKAGVINRLQIRRIVRQLRGEQILCQGAVGLFRGKRAETGRHECEVRRALGVSDPDHFAGLADRLPRRHSDAAGVHARAPLAFDHAAVRGAGQPGRLLRLVGRAFILRALARPPQQTRPGDEVLAALGAWHGPFVTGARLP